MELTNTKLLILASLGVSWVIGGIFMNFYAVPLIVADQIHKKIMLQNGTDMYPMWQKLTVPISFNAYLFNVTNPEAVHGGAKPILQEVGPFCYNLWREKVILDVNAQEGIITYDSRRLFYEKKEKGCVSTETQVTILNFALLGTVHIMLDMIPDFLETFEETIPLMFPGIKHIFTTAAAKDILFNGLLLDCSNEDQILGLVCTNVKSMSPPQVWQAPNGKDYLFAALNYMNGTSEGIFTAKDGVNDVEDLGQLTSYGGETSLPYWRSDECNEIRGTDAYIFPPVENKTELVIFQVDACRKMILEFQEDTELFGIPAKHFVAAKSTFGENEDDGCYCVKHVDEDTKEETITCLKDGAINLSPCFKAPVIVTFPHFLGADEEFKNYAIGLKANKSKHQSEAYIQPRTGIPLRGAKKAQINMFLIKNEDISILNNVSEGLFPILWIEEGADVPTNYKKLLKTVFALLKLLDMSKPIAPLIGFGMIVLAGFFFARINKLFCFAIENQIDIRNDDKPELPGYGENEFYAPMKRGNNITDQYNEMNNRFAGNGGFGRNGGFQENGFGLNGGFNGNGGFGNGGRFPPLRDGSTLNHMNLGNNRFAGFN